MASNRALFLKHGFVYNYDICIYQKLVFRS